MHSAAQVEWRNLSRRSWSDRSIDSVTRGLPPLEAGGRRCSAPSRADCSRIVFRNIWTLIAIPVIAQMVCRHRRSAEGKRRDRNITRKIRQSLMKDKALSSYAHNVNVIVQDGEVTPKGPVR